MPARFLTELFTPEVLAAQRRYTQRAWTLPPDAPRDRLGPDEAGFLAERDSFYLASISSSGWPYVQHRGGPPGIVKVLDERTLAFADFRGNKQLISAGNVEKNDRVALIFLDYPTQTRLKLLGHAHVEDLRGDPARTAAFATPELARKVERLVTVDVVGFDWNCPQHITPRYTVPEIEGLVLPLKRRIAELEAELGRRAS